MILSARDVIDLYDRNIVSADEVRLLLEIDVAEDEPVPVVGPLRLP